MTQNRLIQIAGGLWGVIGTFLILRGILLYQLAIEEQHATLAAIAISVAAGILLGGAKGHFVLTRTARRNKNRIQTLPGPLKIHHIFAKPFYGFIAAMMLLGFLLRSFNGYLGGYVVVGAIYCGIGMALVVSSRIYWKSETGSPVEERA